MTKTKLYERKSSDPKGLAYKVTATNHATYPEWGPANHAADPKSDFGAAATRSSALAAVKAIRKMGKKFDPKNPEHIDAVSKAIHGSPEDYEGKSQGWSKSALELGEPHQNAEKKARRGKLTGAYAGLSEPEKDKDRLIAKTVASNIVKKKLKEETLLEARVRIIKARIRNGKIQRRKKVSNVPGMTLRSGKLKRMSVTERRNRRMGQRKGKMKRRAKLARSLQKRKRSLQKRQRLGL